MSIYVSKIYVANDHSVQLIGIVDQFGDPPLGIFIFILHKTSTYLCFGSLRHCTASQICTVTLLPLIVTTDLILSLKAQLIGSKGEDETFWRHAEWVQQSSNIHFFVLLAAFVPFCYIVSMTCL